TYSSKRLQNNLEAFCFALIGPRLGPAIASISQHSRFVHLTGCSAGTLDHFCAPFPDMASFVVAAA
ncbi:MAG: hypothetical protein KDI56_14650, partial [Xanthomonadales bacterium]|nr:hypothetical protein [Xanthomonadales bacterium]